MHRKWIALAATVVLVAAARPAQAELSVTPSIGALVPTKNLIMAPSTYLRLSNHTLYGLTLGLPVAQRLELQLALTAGNGKMELTGGDSFELSSTALFADLRGRFAVAGSGDTNLGVVLGAGWTDYKIGIFDLAEEMNTLGEGEGFSGELTGIVGLDFRAPLSDRLHVTFGAVDRIHETGLSEAVLGSDTVEKTQHDLQFTAGLRFPLP